MTGRHTTPSHSRKAGKLYRYYVATDAIRLGHADCTVRSVPAAEIEDAVVVQVRHLLETPEIVARTWAAANPDGESSMPEREVVASISAFSPLWDELFPAEQAHRPSAGGAGQSVARWHAGATAGRGAADAGRAAPHTGCQGVRRMKANRNSVKPDWQFDGMTITVRMPMTFVRRGGRKVIVAPDGGDAWALAKPRPDEALIRRVGAGASVKVVAGGGEVSVRGGDRRGRRLTLSFATRLLRLTLLAPTSSRS